MSSKYDCDVSVIGAGPAGSVAAAILCQKGYNVHVIERETFPRFSIGESLLPQCMTFIEEAGMLDSVKKMQFQPKNGATFHFQGNRATFNFHEKSTPGPAETFQVVRADFDMALIESAVEQGANLSYGTCVDAVEFSDEMATLHVSDAGGKRTVRSRFCLDASGYGRVLPRLLGIDKPSNFPARMSFFTHVTDNITEETFDRDNILITVHPEHKDVWFWLIPFSNGRSSIGVVGETQYFSDLFESGKGNQDILQHYISHDEQLRNILGNAIYDHPVRKIEGYACSVDRLYGDSYALLGNAAEFLDPIFSSGVTIAMKSASLAANILDRKFKGHNVDWNSDFVSPLMVGVNTFRAFVESWYKKELIDIFFAKGYDDALIKKYLTSILAGYAWDDANPYVVSPARRLKSLHGVCA